MAPADRPTLSRVATAARTATFFLVIFMPFPFIALRPR